MEHPETKTSDGVVVGLVSAPEPKKPSEKKPAAKKQTGK